MSDFEESAQLRKFHTMLRIVSYNDELEHAISVHDKLLSQEKPVLLIYGRSRSGKSALLGRLSTDITCEEYTLLNQSNRQVNVPQADIEIGPEPTGVTTVANFRSIFLSNSEELVIDLAGYGDGLAERWPLVSILNKMVISHIKRCRIIITIDASAFRSMRGFETLYVKELINLFTPEHYELALNSTSFVITHADNLCDILKKETGASSLDRAIELSIMEMFKVFTDNANVSILLSKIWRNFVTINYYEDDLSTACRKLKSLIDPEKDPLRASMLKFSTADAEDEFNSVFTSVLSKQLFNLNRMEKELMQLYEKSKILYVEELASLKRMLHDLKKCRERMDQLREDIASSADQIGVLHMSMNAQDGRGSDELKKNEQQMPSLVSVKESNKIAFSESEEAWKNLNASISSSRDKCGRDIQEASLSIHRKALEISDVLQLRDIVESAKVMDIFEKNNFNATFGGILRDIQGKSGSSEFSISRIKELEYLYNEYAKLTE